MGLSKFEAEKLIEKLKEQYLEYSKKYEPKWFNLEAFKERYIMAIENKMNLEAFANAEIENFERIVSKLEKKKTAKEAGKDFTIKVEKIIEENLSRVKKYTFIHLHDSAGIEISHFYGAISDFAMNYYSIIWVLVNDVRQKMLLDKFDAKLNELAIPRGVNPPKRLQDHVYVISRPYTKETDIERDKNEYLKESAFILHEIIDFCDKLLQKKELVWDDPVKFDKLYMDDQKVKNIMEKFTGLTGMQAIIKVKGYAQEIIDDFRLKAFKK